MKYSKYKSYLQTNGKEKAIISDIRWYYIPVKVYYSLIAGCSSSSPTVLKLLPGEYITEDG